MGTAGQRRQDEYQCQQQRLLWQEPICIHRRFIVIDLNAVAIAALRIVRVPFFLKGKDNSTCLKDHELENE
jgi:hypothetical protein